MKKKYFLIFFILIAIFLSGCGKKQLMNETADDGNYEYTNKGLGLSVTLPPEFIYYQTQRKETDNYVDIEIFIPTSDREAHKEIPGYAKPLVIRVFEEGAYSQEDSDMYKQFEEDEGRAYTYRFWESIPEDWKGKWSNDMRDEIVSSLEVN